MRLFLSLIALSKQQDTSSCAESNEPDITNCQNAVDEKYGACVTSCNQDPSCASTCNREYAQDKMKCPCEDGCADGCPCPQYDCISETTTMVTTTTTPKPKDSVLILFSSQPSIVSSVITNKFGEEDYSFNFSADSNTEVHASCSLSVKGKMMIFGGTVERRQIAAVEDCQLKRIDDLPFDFYLGGCGYFRNKFHFCFGYDNHTCLLLDNDFEATGESSLTNVPHSNVPIAVGDRKLFIQN